MNSEKELDIIVGTLTGKGYDSFVMSRSSTGKLSEVVAGYLKEKAENKIGNYQGLWLSTYVSWNGQDKPHIVCDMWMDMRKGRMVVDKMIIEKKGEFGMLIKRCELKNLLLDAVPTVQKAIELVNEAVENKMEPEKKRRLRL
jgi:hypothetical protein